MRFLLFIYLFLNVFKGFSQSVTPVDPTPYDTAYIEITSVQNSCQGDTISFGLNTSLLIEQIIEWNFDDPLSGTENTSSSGMPSHVFSSPDTYQVSCILQVNCGGPVDINDPITVPCFYFDTIYRTVTISDCNGTGSDPFLEITHSQDDCLNDTLSFGLSTNLLIEQIIEWNFGDPSSNSSNTSTVGMPSHVFSGPGTYQVSCILQINCGGVVDINDPIMVPCFYYDTIYTTVTIVDCDSTDDIHGIYVPNAFTPNDGGSFNNIFKVEGYGIDPTYFSLEIYNRWGELIFISNNPLMGWDGCYTGSGVIAPVGTYVYSINYKLIDEEVPAIINGHVNLLR